MKVMTDSESADADAKLVGTLACEVPPVCARYNQMNCKITRL